MAKLVATPIPDTLYKAHLMHEYHYDTCFKMMKKEPVVVVPKWTTVTGKKGGKGGSGTKLSEKSRLSLFVTF